MGITTTTDWSAEIAKMEAEFAATLAEVRNMRTGQTYRTGFGGSLTVNTVCYGHADLDEVLAGTADAEMVVLTEDGKTAEWQTWHDGPSEDVAGWVYYERWTPEGRVAHGYVDATTRRLVQAG